MRVVLDTNVVVSGLLKAEGPPGQILDMVLEGALELVVDHRILEEYGSVSRRPELSILPDDLRQFLEFVATVSTHVEAAPLGLALPHQADAVFVEVARSGDVPFLVTGNLRHFPRIPEAVSARGFLDTLRRQQS